jgi:putative transposase
MPRPLRLEFAGALHHVASRGDRREDIFHDEVDRNAWLETLAQCCERFGWIVHAWCQMTNHYHLVIETPTPNLSAGMRQLNGVYTQTYNRRHARVGHVFQGRFKAILVDRDAYLLELLRYVVLNPVRAGMVTHASEWPWSSYRAMVGEEEAPSWLNCQWALQQFSKQPKTQRARYAQFVEQGLACGRIWDALKGQIFLGTDAFAEVMQQRLVDEAKHTQTEIPRAQRKALAKSLDYYRDSFEDPKLGMTAAYATGDYTLQQVADAFGVHYATVSRAVSTRISRAIPAAQKG